jgi:hypothetical protein
VEKLDVPRNHESGRGNRNVGPAGGSSGSEESGLIALENPPGVGIGAGVDPPSGQIRGELWALSNPLGDAGGVGKASGELMERERDGQVVGKTGAGH